MTRHIFGQSHFYKVFEYVMHAMYHRHISTLGIKLPHPTQYGFRRGVGIHELIFQLRLASEKCLLENKELYVASLDISKAFDRVWREAIIFKMVKYDFPPDLIYMINFIFHHTRSGVHNGTDPMIFFDTLSGTPQGGILSPDLFALVLHDLNEALTNLANTTPNTFVTYLLLQHIL